jgi:hypothetical protein
MSGGGYDELMATKAGSAVETGSLSIAHSMNDYFNHLTL